MGAILAAISVSRGGVPKQTGFSALVTANGLDGDRQRGRDPAVVLYPREVMQALQREGHPIAAGAAGENLTVSGLDWARLVPGDEIEVGAVRLAVTKYASPCTKIASLFVGEDFSRILQTLHTG